MEAISILMGAATWSGKYMDPPKSDNDWLGVETMKESELEEIIRDKVVNGPSAARSQPMFSENHKIEA